MYEGNKTMQYAFYAGVLVLFIFGLCYFSTSRIDGRRGEELRARINDCETVNSELQRTNRSIQIEIRGSIERLGNAEQELDRATSSIERCEQILRTAESRAQETDTTIK